MKVGRGGPPKAQLGLRGWRRAPLRQPRACLSEAAQLPAPTPLPGTPLSPTGEPGVYAGIRSEHARRSRGEGRAHLSSPTSIPGLRGHSLKRMPLKQRQVERAEHSARYGDTPGRVQVAWVLTPSQAGGAESKEQTAHRASLRRLCGQHRNTAPWRGAGHQQPTPGPQPPGGSAPDRPGRLPSVCCDTP